MAPKPSTAEQLAPEEDILQAVILADSFNKRFKPLTSRKPRCLLPICNAPLLDWTFESLALAGVQEIFVICRSHADLVKAAIRESKWSKPNSGIKIVPIITAKETFSAGDAMRDIYTHGIITSDFILVNGDLVSNVRIDEVVKEHKERRKTNKDAIMTIIVKESGSSHRTRSRSDTSVFVMDPSTSECLHYEAMNGYPPRKFAHVPREILDEHPEIIIRNDLIDCGIDVCSVEVPSLFQDNFDYADIRRDFVHGILTSDILVKNIHVHVAKQGYAARVQDTKSYDSVSKDILSRWAFPLVPDDNHPAGHLYEYARGNKYIAKDNSVTLSRTCKIGNNTLIGASTKVQDNAKVNSSVIGRRCTIGPGTIIKNAYIFDDTVIGANCIIESSIVGAGVVIKDNTRIDKGCLIADSVFVGPNARLQSFERLSKKRNVIEGHHTDGEDDSDLEAAEEYTGATKSTLGADSNALLWPQKSAEDDEDLLDEREHFNNQRLTRIGDDTEDLDLFDEGSITDSDSELDSDEESDEDGFAIHGLDSIAGSSQSSLPLGPAIEDVADAAAESEFKSEVKASLERAFTENHSVDNAAVELKTLRMASNVSLTLVRQAVIASIVEKIKIIPEGGAAQRSEITAVVNRWGQLINQIGGIDQIETIVLLQKHAATSDRLPLFGQILAAFYQSDIVEEEDIRKWHKIPESRAIGLTTDDHADEIKKCWDVGAHMIFQFDQQDDSDEEEDEEEDESEAEEQPTVKAPAAVPQAPKAPVPQVAESSEEEEETEEEEEEEEEAPAVPKAPATAEPAEKTVPVAIPLAVDSTAPEEVPTTSTKSVEPSPSPVVEPTVSAEHKVAAAAPPSESAPVEAALGLEVVNVSESESGEEESESEAESTADVPVSTAEVPTPVVSEVVSAPPAISTEAAVVEKETAPPPLEVIAPASEKAIENAAPSTVIEPAVVEAKAPQLPEEAASVLPASEETAHVIEKPVVVAPVAVEPSESSSEESEDDEAPVVSAVAPESKASESSDESSSAEESESESESGSDADSVTNSSEGRAAAEVRDRSATVTQRSVVAAPPAAISLPAPDLLNTQDLATPIAIQRPGPSSLLSPSLGPPTPSRLFITDIFTTPSTASPIEPSPIESVSSSGSEEVSESESDSGSGSESDASLAQRALIESRSRSATVTKASMSSSFIQPPSRNRSSTVTQGSLRSGSSGGETTSEEEETDEESDSETKVLPSTTPVASTSTQKTTTTVAAPEAMVRSTSSGSETTSEEYESEDDGELVAKTPTVLSRVPSGIAQRGPSPPATHGDVIGNIARVGMTSPKLAPALMGPQWQYRDNRIKSDLEETSSSSGESEDDED